MSRRSDVTSTQGGDVSDDKDDVPKITMRLQEWLDAQSDLRSARGKIAALRRENEKAKDLIRALQDKPRG